MTVTSKKKVCYCCYFKITPQRENRVKASALRRAWHKVSEIANLVGVSRTTTYAIKKRMNDGESVNRRAGSSRKTVVTACMMPFKAVPGRPCPNMQGVLVFKRRLIDELSLSLEPSPLSLCKDYCSRLLSAPSALNVPRYALMPSSLLQVEAWSSQIRRLGRSILWETVRTTATCLLGTRTRVPAFCKNEKSSTRHVARFCCIQWRSDASVLVLVWVSTDCKALRGQTSWQVGSLGQ